jgi:hypothetical protein
MFESQPMDCLPIWSVYLLAVIFLFLTVEMGFHLGRFVQKYWQDQAKGTPWRTGRWCVRSMTTLPYQQTLYT